MSDTVPIMLGNIKVEPPSTANSRIALIIWGPAGVGKTTLAATAPGKKLWILFDPNGADSIANRDDILVADMTGQDKSIVDKFKSEDPMGLSKLLDSNPEIETIVFDSVTTYSELALNWSVASIASPNVRIEAPSEAGYGRRNIFVAQMVMNLCRLAAKYNRHLILIMHEKMEKDKENINVTTLMVSSGQQASIPVRFSEVWWMQDTGAKGRVIRIRPDRTHKPMKTRMFNPGTAVEFPWKYNPETNEGEGIATWFERWKKANGAKIPLPK